ncbi:uncharacterized protein N7496_002227 [Penicillium cataractarum]|uniref:RanBD1 domain-containing protein n=1 Tax=Penicillium cataractarum TaxID=2100454 RepID=A0A9W9SLB6_9EURO|nr:uncharacterized protein N7496_002227 [Penicillium cataractarum]KAJ5379799.1 hypothetical protein N7496_002227 [Penicillium cataractarum]
MSKRNLETMLTPAPSDVSRIKEIRRRPRGTTPTGGAGEPSGAFSQLSSAPAPSFSAPTNQSTGFSFGQSQSFPGATATPSQPTQGDSAPFSFGGNSSTSFNFGGGFGAPASNPFANNPFTAGNSAPAQPSSTTGSVSFGGLGSQPAAQPTSQPTSQPAFSFGAPQNASSSATTGLFGQPAAPKATGNAVADSMQMSPDAKPKNVFAASSSLPSKNIFGESGASNIFSSKPAAPAGNPFGGLSLPAAAEKPPSDKPEAFAAKPAFASQAPTATSQAQPFGSLFGATPATSNPSEPAKPATNNLFASKAAAPAAAPSNPFMFSKPAASEPEKATTPQVASNNIFSPKPSAEPSTSGNIFAPKPAEQSSTPNLFAPKAPTNDAPSTTAASQPFKNLFGSTTTSQPATLKPATAPASIGNIFAQQSSEEPAVPGPFDNVFKGISKDTIVKPYGAGFGGLSTISNSAQPATATPSLFAPKPVTQQAADKPAETPQPFKNLFGASSTTSKPAEPAAASSPFAPKPATEQPAPSPVKPFGNLLGGKTAAPQPTPVKAPTATSSGIASVQKPEAAIPKPSIPRTTSKDITENAELLWKIRGLDTRFKQEVMKYQPGTDTFDNLILYYIKIRKGMGAPIKGAPELQVKKTVEKSVHVDGPNGSATSSVFAKSFSSPSPSPAQPVAASNPAQSATGNLFAKSMSNGSAASPAPVASPAPKLGGNMFAQPASPAPAASPAPKVPGNMFGQPASPAPATSPAPKLAGNMFAQSASAVPTASTAPKLAGNMFAQSTSATAPNGSAAPAPPKFGNGVGAVDFMAQFKKQAEKTMAEEKAKRKAEDFDSDDDDEEEWERRDAEQQREKRAKLEASSQKKSVFRNGKFEWVDVDGPASAETSSNAVKPAEKPAASSLFVPADNAVFSAASPASSTGSIFESSSRPLPASENIFGRLTPKPTEADKDSDESGDEGKASSSKRPAEEDASTDDDFASALRNSKRTKPSEQTDAAKSSLDTPVPAPTPTAGRSLFDRIQSPAPTPTPQKETSTSTSSLFSASFGQSTSFGKSISFGQNNAAPATDKTWKPTSPIKFSTDSALSVTSAPASTLASTQPSSGVNSGDATPDEETAPGEVFDMSQANAGEEEETLVFECRARAFKLTTGWTSQGTGVARLLKHPETGRARIVLRADPGGNIILNTLLKKEFDYSRQSNSVQFMVPQADSEKPEQWAIRVKAESIEELYSKIQEIKN